MPASFRVFPQHNLACFRYSGMVTTADYLGVLRGFPQDPDFKLGLKHVTDISDLQEIEADHAAMMQIQAKIAEYVVGAPVETLSVIIAPTEAALNAAAMVLRSWKGLDVPIARSVVASAEEAAKLLGIDEAVLETCLSEIA